MKRKINTHMITSIAVLAAISILFVSFIHFPILPMVPYLEYDPADIPIFIGTFAFGPLSGFILTVIVSVIQGFISGGFAVQGIIMHILATGVFALVAGNIYKRSRTLKGAWKAMVIGIVVWVGSMAVWNIILTPFLVGMDYNTFWVQFPFIVVFNVIKAVINGLVTMILYKHIGKIFKKTGAM